MRLEQLMLQLLGALLCVSLLIVSARGDNNNNNSSSSSYISCGSELLEGLDIPAVIEVPAGHTLRVAYYAEGLQHYVFNGSDWVLFNATATLYSVVKAGHNMTKKVGGGGRKLLQAETPTKMYAVGQHFFLGHPDPAGGQPSWETTIPAYSLVTARSLQTVTVDPHSISWDLFQATAHSGSSDVLGAVTYVQRLASKGGLPPATTLGAQFDDIHLTPYSIIYAFYVKSN